MSVCMKRCWLLALLFFSSASGLSAQELRRVVGPDHPLLSEPNVYLGYLVSDRLGNVFSFSGTSVVKISPNGQSSLILKTDGLGTILLGEDGAPGKTIDGQTLSVLPITDMVVSDSGDIYIAGRNTDNVVRIRSDGVLEEILTSSGDGHGAVLERPTHLSLDNNGVVYVTADGSQNLFAVPADGPIKEVLSKNGIGGELYIGGGEVVFDTDNTGYVASTRAIFKISPTGEISEYFTGDLENFTGNPHAGMMALDDYGNLYFTRSHGDGPFRINPDGSVHQLIEEIGDGTGESQCVEGPFHSNICEYFGNRFSSASAFFIDAAQNVFVVSGATKNLFKINPLGVTTEVFDLNDIDNFHLENISQAVMDPFGSFYFLNHRVSSIFKLAPLPIGKAQDRSLDLPHANIYHDEAGIDWLPDRYSFTRFTANLSDSTTQGMDTRSEPLSSLLWQNGTVTTATDNSVVPAVARMTTSLNVGSNFYQAEVEYRVLEPTSLNEVTAIRYSRNGLPVFDARGLAFPLDSLFQYSGQYLMRWVYYRDDVIYGGAGHDVLYGFDGDDILYGFNGNDAFNGGRGRDIYYGGDGIDTVYYEADQQDYGLSRNPQSGAVEIQPKVGMTFPTADVAHADIEFLQFRDSKVATSDIGYWGESSVVAGTVASSDEDTIVYRFYNTRDQAQFFTAEEAEKNTVIRHGISRADESARWPYVFQGAKFRTANSYAGAGPLYRFYNTRTGHHFYTADLDEVAHVRAQIRDAGWPFVYEGPRFTVYLEDPNPATEGMELPVYRYYSPEMDRHFFTTSEYERRMLDSLENWQFEGVRFWVEKLVQ